MVVCYREKWKNIPWGLGQLQIDIYGINFALLTLKFKIFPNGPIHLNSVNYNLQKIVMCCARIIF